MDSRSVFPEPVMLPCDYRVKIITFLLILTDKEESQLQLRDLVATSNVLKLFDNKDVINAFCQYHKLKQFRDSGGSPAHCLLLRLLYDFGDAMFLPEYRIGLYSNKNEYLDASFSNEKYPYYPLIIRGKSVLLATNGLSIFGLPEPMTDIVERYRDLTFSPRIPLEYVKN